MSITDQLEAERRIMNAATAGPWEWGQRTMGDELTRPTLLGDPDDPDPLRRAMAYGHPWNILKTTGDWRPTEADAAFIAHARTALPLRNKQVEAVLTVPRQPITQHMPDWLATAAEAYNGALDEVRRAIEEAGA